MTSPIKKKKKVECKKKVVRNETLYIKRSSCDFVVGAFLHVNIWLASLLNSTPFASLHSDNYTKFWALILCPPDLSSDETEGGGVSREGARTADKRRALRKKRKRERGRLWQRRWRLPQRVVLRLKPMLETLSSVVHLGGPSRHSVFAGICRQTWLIF